MWARRSGGLGVGRALAWVGGMLRRIAGIRAGFEPTPLYTCP